MKHLIDKINFNKVKEQLVALRIALPELIIGLVIGIILNYIWC